MTAPADVVDLGHRLEVVAFRRGVREAVGSYQVTPNGGGQMSFWLNGLRHPANSYRVDLFDPSTDPEPGWVTAKTLLQVNGTQAGRGLLPVTWYAAEPTDWPTGIVRAPLPEWAPGDVWTDVIWSLAFRRAA